jgi:hypothetical protein
MTLTSAAPAMSTPRLKAAWPDGWRQSLTDAYLQADAASQIGDAGHKQSTLLDVTETLRELLQAATGSARPDLAWRVERLHAAAVDAREAQPSRLGSALGELVDKLGLAMAEEPAVFA